MTFVRRRTEGAAATNRDITMSSGSAGQREAQWMPDERELLATNGIMGDAEYGQSGFPFAPLSVRRRGVQHPKWIIVTRETG